MRIRIVVALKNGVLDPQGQALKTGLHQLGFAEIEAVKVGKVVELELAEADKEKALQRARQMCEKLLVNEAVEVCTTEVFP